jgi:hypothetical protein
MKKVPHRTRSLHDIKTWPPGEFILIDQNEEWKRMGSPAHLRPFVGLGMVVANDGVSQIAVLWGGNCKDGYTEYDVTTLNEATIYHVE